MDFSEQLSKFEEGSKERIFFERVLEKLNPNFIRKSVEDRKREVHIKLDNAIQDYFQTHIFSTALTKSVEQLEAQQSSAASSSSVHPVYLNLVKKYLSPEVRQPKLFGLSEENVSKTLGSKNLESETQALKKQIEGNINEFCIKLIQCTGGTVLPGKDWKSAFDSTIKDLEYKATLLSFKENTERSKRQVREMFNTYYQELSKGIALLTKLLSLHEKKLEFESNLANFYLQRCRAVSLKLRVFEMKIIEMTYNKETVPALQKISEELVQREQKLEEEQNEKVVALDQYLKLGEKYESLVEEYTRLTKRIKEQQWSVDELKSRSAQPGALGTDYS